MKFTDAKALHFESWLLEAKGSGLFLVKSTFRYYIDYETKNEYVEVKEGFVTNFGSIPRLLRPFFDPVKYISYIFHDYLYSKKAEIIVENPAKVSEYSRKILQSSGYHIELWRIFKVYYTPSRLTSDKILNEGIQIEGGTKIERFFIYYGLRLWGGPNFRKS